MKNKTISLYKANPKPGTWFKATIEGVPVVGKIQKENNSFYLCQNKKDGTEADDMLGFKFSWTASDGTLDSLERTNIKNLVLLKSKPKDFKFEPIMRLGDYNVVFNKGFITVGCTTITNAQILKVAKKQGLI